MSDLVLYVNAANERIIKRLRARRGGAAKNDATIAWQLVDSCGKEVASGTASYIADTQGDYLVLIDLTSSKKMRVDDSYTLLAEDTALGWGIRGTWKAAYYTGRGK